MAAPAPSPSAPAPPQPSSSSSENKENKPKITALEQYVEHHKPDGLYENPWKSFHRHQFKDYYKAFSSFRPVDLPPVVRAPPIVAPLWDSITNPPKDHIQITWVGHATFLVQMYGLNILTDPIFSERCSAVQWIGPKRFVPAPFPIKQLPPIDFVIISHNHYDHLDTESVNELLPKVKQWFVPMGVKKWMVNSGAKENSVVELDWWQRSSHKDQVDVTCCPCQHFTGRTPFDRNETLWASWAIHTPKGSMYFAGDTGYRSVPKDKTEDEIKKMDLPICPAFKQIGQRLGPFDLSCIPIGAYSPRWFMSPVHCNPEDAVNVHLDVKSKQSVGMHWGTFTLTDEPIWEPPALLASELKAKNVDNGAFVVLLHGQTRAFPLTPSTPSTTSTPTTNTHP